MVIQILTKNSAKSIHVRCIRRTNACCLVHPGIPS